MPALSAVTRVTSQRQMNVFDMVGKGLRAPAIGIGCHRWLNDLVPGSEVWPSQLDRFYVTQERSIRFL